jgi:hypothetical protein
MKSTLDIADIPLEEPPPPRFPLASPLALSFALFVSVFAVGWGAITLEFFGSDRPVERLTEMWRPEIIVVLAGDPERKTYAESLTQKGVRAPIVSTLTDFHCMQAGNPSSACNTGVRNTVDEALLMRRILSEDHVEHVAIVTSRYQAARAASIFGIIFAGSRIDVSVVAPPRSSDIWQELRAKELLKWFPSIVAAMLARFTPDTYDWVMQYRYGPSSHIAHH